MSVFQDRLDEIEIMKNFNSSFCGLNSIMFYGSNGKSALTGALSKALNKPVLELSPKGDNNFQDEFPLLLSAPISNLKELRDIIAQFELESSRIKKIYIANAKKDTVMIEAYKKQLGAEYDKLKVFADKKEYPIAAICLSEYSTVNSWIEDEVAESMGLKVVGDKDNKTIGSDWSHYKKEVMDLFSSLRRLPMLTIFNTGELHPDDKKDLSQIIPNIASGQAQRLIIDGLSAMFRVGLNKEGKHIVSLYDTSKTKPYIKNVYTKKELLKEIDVTNCPEKFWSYLQEIRNTK